MDNLVNKIFNKYFRHNKFTCCLNDIFEILNLIIYLFIDYIELGVLQLNNPDFHKYINNEIKDIIKIQLNDNSIIINDNDISICISIIEKIIFKYLIPPRSYKDNSIKYIKTEHQINKLKDQLYYLKNIYQPEQRTNEWYLFRHNVITASNIWKAFSTVKTFEQLVIEKCKPIDINKYNYVNEQSPMHWGQKYEPVSIQYYEYKYNTIIDEYGCIPHKDFKYLAASPDGINTLEDSYLFGRMLEIKNIFNRVISGIPKFEYWIQMQIQMEVCDLNECDFLETRFLEYYNKQEFLEDYYLEIDISGNHNKNLMKTKDNKFKGMIIAFFKDNKPYYKYSPFAHDYNTLIKWEEDILEKNNNLEWFKNIYYRLDEISCVLVLRNKHWFNSALPIIRELWDTINEKKNNNEFIESITKKNYKKDNKKDNKKIVVNKISNIEIKSSSCLIDTSLYTDIIPYKLEDVCKNTINNM